MRDIWLLSEGHCFRDQVLKICSQKLHSKVIDRGITFESGNLETLKNMVLKFSGYTLLPHLAVKQLPTHQKKLVREFIGSIPTREISIVHSRSFLKEKIINAVEEEIINSLPSDLKSMKRKKIEVIEIY